MHQPGHSFKHRQRFRSTGVVRRYFVPLLWLGMLFYGLLIFGGCAVLSFWHVQAVAPVRPDGIMVVVAVVGVLSALFVPVLLYEIFQVFRRVYRRQRAAIGFRREHRRLSSIKWDTDE